MKVNESRYIGISEIIGNLSISKKLCEFIASPLISMVLPIYPHLGSSSGSGGGGVLALRSNKGFFGFSTDSSTVPEASAANILENNVF